jgi:phasin family protein
MSDEVKKTKPKRIAAKAVPASRAVAKSATPKAAPAPAPLVAAAMTAAPAAAPAEAVAPLVAEISAPEAIVASDPVSHAQPIEPAVIAEPVIATAPPAAPIVAATSVPKTVKRSPLKTSALQGASNTKKEVFTMTTTTTAMTDTIQTAMKDAADKAKATMEKSQAAMGDMSAFAKGNVEAVVEAGKILASGMQEMSKGYMTDSKSAVETMTAEIKDLAAVKSPAEFFEKQSAMMRKQFDAAVATSSKNSEAMLKLASEAFQPISNRVSLAVEKIKHAA